MNTTIPVIIIHLSSKLDSNGTHFKDAIIEDIPDAKNDKDEEEKDEKKKLNTVGIFELFAFADKWDKKYPVISRSWHHHWDNLVTIFDYPDEIRKIIFTTNAIESLNSVIRKAIRNRKIFPNDDSALKVVYLAIENAAKKWSMPLRDWKSAMNRFAIEFQGRFPE